MIGDGGVAATLQRLALGMRRATEEFTIKAMHAIPPLLADAGTISGRLGMEGNVLRASSFTLPLKPFSSIRTALIDQPALSIFGRSADDGTGASRFRARTEPIGRNPFLPSSVLLYATTRYSGPSSFASFGRCISDWEGDIAEIRVFRGDGRDGWDRRLESL